MTPRKVTTIIGARPQFIKAAMVSRAMQAHGGLVESMIHTGQHFDAMMSDVFFSEMEIPAPKHHLGIGGLSHGAMTGRMLEAIEAVLMKDSPDVVLVYGDTDSTLAGALAAAKLRVPLAHVEAGLRSFNRRMPEEINRVLADHVSSMLFAPTSAAVENLQREGISRSAIELTGDVMFDAALAFGEIAKRRSRILETLGLGAEPYLLATVHRAENTDESSRLDAIVDALMEVARWLPVILPLHPRTRQALAARGRMDALASAVRLIDPIGYVDMVRLEMGAALIATDSGGVQKEAYFYRVPCVTLRDETEWVELLAAGVNRLASPTDARSVVVAIEAALACPYPAAAEESQLYGDGRASARIASILAEKSLALSA